MKKPHIGKKYLLMYILLLAALSVVSTTFAWVMVNRIVNGNNLGMAAYGTEVKIEYAVFDNDTSKYSEYVPFDPDHPVKLTNGIQYPGDTQKYRIRITNIGEEPARITSFGIKAPTKEEEAPNKAGYSFSTQITVALLEVDGVAQNADAKFLAAYETGQTLAPITDLELWAGKTLAKSGETGDTVELTVQFTFVNKNERQNEYIQFGTEPVGGVCQRRFYISFALE